MDDQQRDALQPVEFGVEVAAALRVGQPSDSFGGGAERHAVAG